MAEDDIVKTEAVTWVTRLNSGESGPEDRELFEAWVSRSDLNRTEYQRADRWLRELRDRTPETLPEVVAALRYRPRRRYFALSLAASILVIIAVAFLLFDFNSREGASYDYQTAKGQQQDIKLADGSQVKLNTDSQIGVRFSSELRRIELIRGEVLVTVNGADHRPLQVVAANGIIRDLGTVFDVYRRPNNISVTVLQGAVSVTMDTGEESKWLGPGERIAYNDAGHFEAKQNVNMNAATAWSRDLFVFRDTPLQQVVQEVQRYHDKNILIADPSLGQLALRGTFKIDNLDALLLSIEAVLPVNVSHRDDGTIVLSAIETPITQNHDDSLPH